MGDRDEVAPEPAQEAAPALGMCTQIVFMVTPGIDHLIILRVLAWTNTMGSMENGFGQVLEMPWAP